MFSAHFYSILFNERIGFIFLVTLDFDGVKCPKQYIKIR